jgi:uncharacterized protein (TIGR02271 family)
MSNINTGADITGDNNSFVTNEKHVIPVIQEQLHITKQVIESGTISISKKIIEENYDAELSVYHEDLVVERIAKNEYIEGDLPKIRTDGDTTIIPVIKEIIIKRIMLIEELHITKRKTDALVPVHEVLRKEEITISRSDRPSAAE